MSAVVESDPTAPETHDALHVVHGAVQHVAGRDVRAVGPTVLHDEGTMFHRKPYAVAREDEGSDHRPGAARPDLGTAQ